ncbi:hypothetical protein [Planctomicrobium piriforme]|uniref:Uncharacterized protein n=1 Tax=Planctomicrobium piriforme TaxID=1576369 RepID=A0A1I3LQ91_9PLAN|nr:hypothetical protein [Planctomicrobium piriforme]SFI86939.1 hypothetical protein SAMN05421753_11335 [Planctomicrobium piriforme]
MGHLTRTATVFLLLAGIATAADPVGELRKVECREGMWMTVPAKPGDLIQLSFFGGTYPGGMIDNLKVAGLNNSVKKVSVVFIPQISPDGQPLIGGLELAGFFTYHGGSATLMITPTGEQVEPKTYKIEIVPFREPTN